MSKEAWNTYMREYRKKNKDMSMEERAKDRALALLKLFEKKIKDGSFEVESASWWEGMKKSATLRIDVLSNSYEDYDDIPRN